MVGLIYRPIRLELVRIGRPLRVVHMDLELLYPPVIGTAFWRKLLQYGLPSWYPTLYFQADPLDGARLLVELYAIDVRFPAYRIKTVVLLEVDLFSAGKEHALHPGPYAVRFLLYLLGREALMELLPAYL